MPAEGMKTLNAKLDVKFDQEMKSDTKTWLYKDKELIKLFPVVVSGILIVASAGTGFADSGSAVEFAITGASLGIDIGSEIADALVG